jgi:small subunit ribosomal protein S20
MANHPSAEKRNRQRVRRTERNRSIKGAVRTIVKSARTLVETAGTKKQDAVAAVSPAARALDRAASKGAVHPKTAARRKSRLARAAHKAASAS